jgi:hypothetical protein
MFLDARLATLSGLPLLIGLLFGLFFGREDIFVARSKPVGVPVQQPLLRSSGNLTNPGIPARKVRHITKALTVRAGGGPVVSAEKGGRAGTDQSVQFG